jgi:hypothetical protein
MPFSVFPLPLSFWQPVSSLLHPFPLLGLVFSFLPWFRLLLSYRLSFSFSQPRIFPLYFWFFSLRPSPQLHNPGVASGRVAKSFIGFGKQFMHYAFFPDNG